ncbi:TIGR04197 family type VII secretion effector [Microbacterium sp. NPDC087868]|uniref:TIGR04197 family type VII secretion effector n=1 Tax=Microbacterium sp. NPDC087868 TaxID=3364195 RepID=UPI00384DCF9B
MKVDYGSLEAAASALSTAASAVSAEGAVPSDLGSGASGPDSAHTSTLTERNATTKAMGEVMIGQSKACTELINLFKLLDAQIASQVPGA